MAPTSTYKQSLRQMPSAGSFLPGVSAGRVWTNKRPAPPAMFTCQPSLLRLKVVSPRAGADHRVPLTPFVVQYSTAGAEVVSGYPRHRENRENGQKNSLSGKTQGIWKFCQNTDKTQGILSKHRENTENFVSSSCKCSDSKSKGYCDSCRKKVHFFPRSWIGLPSQFFVCNSHKLLKWAQGKFAVRQGKHREFENTISVGTLGIAHQVLKWYTPYEGPGLANQTNRKLGAFKGTQQAA